MSVVAAFILSVSGLFLPLGPEAYVSRAAQSLPSTISPPDVAVANDGRTVAVYATESPAVLDINVVNALVILPDGSTVLREALFGAGQLDVVYHNPAVAMAADGRFVVVAEREDVSAGDRDIVARTFAADGTPEQATFTVNAPMPVRNQTQPAVAMFANGDFYVVWTEEFSMSDDDIYHAIWFNSTTNPFSQFLVPTSFAATNDRENKPRIAVDPGQVQASPAEPSIVVCYRRPNANNGESEYVAQRVNTAGTQLGSPVPFSTSDPDDGMTDGDVAMDDSGGYVAVWLDNGLIFRRRFDSSGVPLGAGALNAGPGFAAFHEGVRVSTGTDGDYTVSIDYSGDLFYAEYNADDSTRLNVAKPDSVTGMRPGRGAIDVSRNGVHAALAWRSQIDDARPVYARRFRRVGETVDSDGDGFSDSFESMNNSNPADPNSRPAILDLNFDGQVNAADAFFWYRSMIGAPPRTVPSTP